MPKSTKNTGTPEDKNNRGCQDSNFIVQCVIAAAGVAVSIFTLWLVITARNTEERQLRAYVGTESKLTTLRCGSCESNIPPRKKIEKAFYDDDFVAIGVRNFGQTPANEFSVTSSWKEMPFGEELPIDFTYPDTSLDEIAYPMSKSVLNPGDPTPVGNQFGPKTVTLIIKARNHQASAYIYGHIDYRDVFDKTRSTLFCFRYAPDVSDDISFTLCPDHNSPKKDDY